MDVPNNALVRRYLSAETSAKSDWLQLLVMLVLLVVARMAQPLPAVTPTVPKPSLSRYLLPAADSSRFAIYDTNYNAHFLLGR
ncbi:hypothetical protein [Hymenobacter negativus]|uniref:Uncharacterized protein n=1 Tax=Hymenobacter negativus TaxID=2795026 RepID=A0ABS3QMV9_9BACT|nr:hypothetical protein [Hymenobacter negativus]MBO2012613.1 hypothetical protein [Hymenobacter negativus]